MEELIPCPLCGGEVSIALCGDDVEHYFMVTRGLVRTADSCRCRLFLESSKFTDMDKADAVRRELVYTWNTRATQTCKMVFHEEGNIQWLSCSKCGGKQSEGGFMTPCFIPNYCRCCGRKVVS